MGVINNGLPPTAPHKNSHIHYSFPASWNFQSLNNPETGQHHGKSPGSGERDIVRSHRLRPYLREFSKILKKTTLLERLNHNATCYILLMKFGLGHAYWARCNLDSLAVGSDYPTWVKNELFCSLMVPWSVKRLAFESVLAYRSVHYKTLVIAMVTRDSSNAAHFNRIASMARQIPQGYTVVSSMQETLDQSSMEGYPNWKQLCVTRVIGLTKFTAG